MGYVLATLWYERQRFLPGVLAVTFSAVLIALQCGLLLGLFSITSIPIDHSRADLWIGSAEVLSVDIGRPIPESFGQRLSHCPEIGPMEPFLQGFAHWTKPSGGSELCIVIGSRLEDGAMGPVEELTPELRRKLTQPNTIVVDESELGRLGLKGIGDQGEVLGIKVRVVGLVKGLKSLAGPYIFCSLQTARPLLRTSTEQATYLLAKSRRGNLADATEAVKKLKHYTDMSIFTSHDFSLRSRIHWVTKTKAGVALGYAALLGLLVGAVVTSQTLYAATMASMREYAILLALGIPRWRLALTVVWQAFWVGILGVLLSLPVSFLLAELADWAGGVRVLLPNWLLLSAAIITLTMAILSGLAALRSLRQIEPVNLLR